MLAFAYGPNGSGEIITWAMNFDSEESLETYRPLLATIWPGWTWAPAYEFPSACWVGWVRDTPEGSWYNPNPTPEARSPDLS